MIAIFLTTAPKTQVDVSALHTVAPALLDNATKQYVPLSGIVAGLPPLVYV